MEIRKILSNIEQKKCQVQVLSWKVLYTYIRHSATQWELVQVTPQHTVLDVEKAFQDVINKPAELLNFEVFNTRILKCPKTGRILPKLGTDNLKIIPKNRSNGRSEKR